MRVQGRCRQPHRSVEAGVVEEVVEVPLPGPVGGVLDDARRDRLEAQRVVDQHGDPHTVTGGHVVGDVELERGVTALVADDLGVVDPHRRSMRRRLEVQRHPAALPAPRHPHHRLVPDVTEEVAHRRIGGKLVEAGRYRHGPGVGSGPRNQPAARPSPCGSRVKSQSPSRFFRSRTALSCGRSMVFLHSRGGDLGLLSFHRTRRDPATPTGRQELLADCPAR